VSVLFGVLVFLIAYRVFLMIWRLVTRVYELLPGKFT
jgi:hypothetical protein